MISITPETQHTVAVDDQEIIVSFKEPLKSNTHYTVSINDELTTTTGEKARGTQTVSFTTEGKDGPLRWRGSSTPETFYKGLKLDTISSGKVSYSLYQFSVDAAEGRPLDDPIYSETLNLDQSLSVADLPNGRYLVKASSGEEEILKTVYISNLTHFVKLHRGAQQGWVFDAETRTPVEVEIDCYKDGAWKSVSKTDSDGYFDIEVCESMKFTKDEDVAIYTNPKFSIPQGGDGLFEFDRKEPVVTYNESAIYNLLEENLLVRKVRTPFAEEFFYLRGLLDEKKYIPYNDYLGVLSDSIEGFSGYNKSQVKDVSKDVVVVPSKAKNPLYFSFVIGDQLLGPKQVTLKEGFRDPQVIKAYVDSTSREGVEASLGQKAYTPETEVTLRYSFNNNDVSPTFRVYRKETLHGEYVLEHEQALEPQEDIIGDYITYTLQSRAASSPYTYYIFEFEITSSENGKQYISKREIIIRNDEKESFIRLLGSPTQGAPFTLLPGQEYVLPYNFTDPANRFKATLTRDELLGYDPEYGYAYLNEVGERDITQYYFNDYTEEEYERYLSANISPTMLFKVPQIEPGVYGLTYEYDDYEVSFPNRLYVPQSPRTNSVREDTHFVSNYTYNNKGYYANIDSDVVTDSVVEHYVSKESRGVDGDPGSFDGETYYYKILDSASKVDSVSGLELSQNGEYTSPRGAEICYLSFDEVDQRILWKETCQYLRSN